MKNFKFIDLFAGIGGFRIALENAGGICVFSSEIDENCREVYFNNFNSDIRGDITQIKENSIPDHDILTAGFPCQAFSIAGARKGFRDHRGSLFFEVLRVTKAKKPKAIILENVKNLIYHDQKRTFDTIKKSLEDLGYFFSWKILNAKDFGLAQNRERVVIVASKEKFDFNIDTNFKKNNIKNIINSYSDNVLSEKEYTIIDKNLWKKQNSGMIFVGYRNKPLRKKGINQNTQHLSRVHKQPNRIYHVKGTHPALSSQETSGRYFVYDDFAVRKLTIEECYALQGFPKNFKISSSKTNAYKQIGNSVAVPKIEAVAKEVVKKIL